MENITFNFRNNNEKQAFIAWFLDAGGDQNYGQCCNDHNIPSQYPDQAVKGSWDVINMLVEEE